MYILYKPSDSRPSDNVSYAYQYRLISEKGVRINFLFQKRVNVSTTTREILGSAAFITFQPHNGSEHQIFVRKEVNLDEDEMQAVFRKYVDVIDTKRLLINESDFKTTKQIEAEQAASNDNDNSDNSDASDSD